MVLLKTSVKHSILYMLLVLSFPLLSSAAEPEWHEATEIGIDGLGWAEAEQPYCRLPLRAKEIVAKGLWNLSIHSAGLHVRFVTNSPTVALNWSLTSNALDMPHMPATGVSGLDLYKKSADGNWRYLKNARPSRKENNTTTAKTKLQNGESGEFLLYLPLYNGVESLKLGVKPGSKISKASDRKTKPVVVYGTSIAQGACASRPGMAWTSILGRELDREIINLGFSGSGKMEEGAVELVGELDPGIFIIDCLWNMRGFKKDLVQQRVENLARTLHKLHPDTPLVFVGQSHYDSSAHPTSLSKYQSEVIERLQKEGVKGLHLIPGKDLIGNDTEGTVDGIHPNDLGMLRHGKAVAEKIKPILDNRL